MSLQVQQESIFKAKLFKLNEENEWEDMGIVYPSIQKKEKTGYFLICYKEKENTVVDEHKINGEISYEQSEEKVINWNNDVIDMAISFESEIGAQVIWDKIQEILDNVSNVMDLEGEDENEESKNYLLQIPTQNNLKALAQEIADMPASQKQDFFSRIFPSRDKVIILNLIDQVGAQKPFLEYRKFLKNQVKHISVVDLKDDRRVEQIHLIYRLSYLKDCVLGDSLDGKSLQLINLIIQMTQQDLIGYIMGNKDILGSLIDKIRNIDIKALKFVYEMFNIMKQLDASDIVRGILTVDANNNSASVTFEICKIVVEQFLDKMVTSLQQDPGNQLDKANIKNKIILDILIQIFQTLDTTNETKQEMQVELDKHQLLEKFGSVVEHIGSDELNPYLKNSVEVITEYLFKKIGRKENLIFAQIMELIYDAYKMKQTIEKEKKKYNYGRDIENTYYDLFEEEFLNFIKNKNYKYLKNVMLETPKKLYERETQSNNNEILHQKNEALYDQTGGINKNHLNNIDLPYSADQKNVSNKINTNNNSGTSSPVNKGLAYKISIKKPEDEKNNQQQQQQQNNSIYPNGKRNSINSMSALVDYEDDEEVNDEPQKKVKVD
ncbi:hypothetical protein PPERSA_07679 [Pseudocohnilembus persalinus]|uniref:Serine/threonine-protein phosphatase 4 regulatory subunit 3-like central domain-containing protein n=1 Tax=Pseudocohnilembus persalinus TaxID=266149 RepID=A0A0V0QIH9_PSEPJ|nr:hypothetical protein PPERSA_07679 [Pseudocohnilembus persalinus]|eukprot:KRX02034.1 hypothetical protein PPERSA_07679 [Pseudocohnilembus persalinus]